MVSDNPTLDCNFIIKDIPNKSIAINNNRTITMSRTILGSLKDEAQLAALISYLMIQFKPEYQGKHTLTSENDAIAYDQLSMTYLYKAGYDPMSAIELQEIYNTKEQSNNWLAGVFSNYPLTANRATANRNFLNNLPKGTQRAEQRYQKNLGLQE